MSYAREAWYLPKYVLQCKKIIIIKCLINFNPVRVILMCVHLQTPACMCHLFQIAQNQTAINARIESLSAYGSAVGFSGCSTTQLLCRTIHPDTPSCNTGYFQQVSCMWCKHSRTCIIIALHSSLILNSPLAALQRAHIVQLRVLLVTSATLSWLHSLVILYQDTTAAVKSYRSSLHGQPTKPSAVLCLWPPVLQLQTVVLVWYEKWNICNHEWPEGEKEEPTSTRSTKCIAYMHACIQHTVQVSLYIFPFQLAIV